MRTPFLIFYRAEKHEKFEDMKFVLVVEWLDILQSFEPFGIEFDVGLTQEMIERDLESISDVNGDLDGGFYFIGFIPADNIPRGTDLFIQLFEG